tara:strand:+ start:51 stop:566 length:516 start_codon:yes stop_codon:yes gene_type:complete
MRFFLSFILLLNFCCFNAFAQEQTSAIGYYTSGLDHYSKQNYKEAIEHYSLAININPNFAEAYFQRGCSKHNADDYKGAITDFNTSIKLQPNNQLFYKQRASSKTMLKDYIGAIADCDQAIILKSDYDKAYALRGILKIELGEKKGCVDLEKAGQLGYQNATVFLKKYCEQ